MFRYGSDTTGSRKTKWKVLCYKILLTSNFSFHVFFFHLKNKFLKLFQASFTNCIYDLGWHVLFYGTVPRMLQMFWRKHIWMHQSAGTFWRNKEMRGKGETAKALQPPPHWWGKRIEKSYVNRNRHRSKTLGVNPWNCRQKVVNQKMLNLAP